MPSSAEVYLERIWRLLGIGGIVPVPLPVTDNGGSLTVDGTVAISTNPVPTSENWRVTLVADEVVDDSDKTFTVTASQEWEILSIWIELTTTATVGNRQITVDMLDSANDVIGSFVAGANQAASLGRNYMFAPMLQLMTAFSGVYLSFPLPPFFLPAGYKIRVYDSAAIAAAADDMIVQMTYAWRTV
jgi:hypothetical protein